MNEGGITNGYLPVGISDFRSFGPGIAVTIMVAKTTFLTCAFYVALLAIG